MVHKLRWLAFLIAWTVQVALADTWVADDLNLHKLDGTNGQVTLSVGFPQFLRHSARCFGLRTAAQTQPG